MRICFVIVAAFVLVACGGEQSSSGESADASAMDDAAAEYQKKVSAKVSAKVSDSMVKAFMSDFGITEDQARCLVNDIGASNLMRAETDEDVQAQIRACGVDPAVVR
ncbi:MAG: hypothetical protein HKN81_01330 [Gammaproteobacteria bacterium]|nr:hypothetical protein [Gammaproteobacteria bacterium]NND35750.1 hypothetical protein [Gammaproteobacteria bacterium]